MWWNESGFIPRGLLRFTQRKCGNWITLPSADFPWGYLDVPFAHALEKELSDRLGLYLKCDFFEWITWQKLVPLILTLPIASLNGTSPGLAGWLIEDILYQWVVVSGGIQNKWVPKSFCSPTQVPVQYWYVHGGTLINALGVLLHVGQISTTSCVPGGGLGGFYFLVVCVLIYIYIHIYSSTLSFSWNF